MTICTLTEAAKQQVNTLCEENNCYAVSLNLSGGGCAWLCVAVVSRVGFVAVTRERACGANACTSESMSR